MTNKRIPKDQNIRDNALASNHHSIVLANAGSGKTTILTEKLMKEASEEKCHYFFAAITFTNKAAKEITERLKQK